MIHVAIVEDDDAFAGELTEFLRRFEGENDLQMTVCRYTDGSEIAEAYNGRTDLILMDIQMTRMDGMEAAELIRQKDSEVVIIFITNRSDFAIRGYQVDALDYVLKPINYLSFEQKMQRAMQRLAGRQGELVTVNTRGGMRRIRTTDIYYIESMGHNITWHTAQGDFTVRDRLQDLEQKLLDLDFFRNNKGCLVNFRHVDGVQDGCCLVHGQKLPVSRARRAEFLAALARYMGEN